MNIIEARTKFLTNQEILEHLQGAAADFSQLRYTKDKHYHRTNLSIVDYEVLSKQVVEYCTKTPARSQTREKLALLLAELSEYELEVIEKFQIVNLVPRNIVNLYAIVEECDLRFTEEQSQAIIDALARYFPEEFEDIQGEDEGEGGEYADGEEYAEQNGETGAQIQVDGQEEQATGEEYREGQEVEEMDVVEEDDEEAYDNDELVGDAGNAAMEDYEAAEE